MAGWEIVVVFNFVTASSYVGIAFFIIRGLIGTRQLLRNYLAVATAAIFLTCGAHHVLHALDLFTAGDAMQTSMMREIMGQSLDVVVTGSTAITGVLYLGLRRSYGMLLRSPALFDDAAETRYRQLAANLPHTAVSVFDLELRYTLVAGAGLAAVGYESSTMEGSLVEEVVPPQVWTELERYYRLALAGEFSEFDHTSTVTGVIFHNRMGPLMDEGGRIIGGLAISEDVTAQRRLQAELQEAQGLFHQLASSVDVAFLLRNLDPPEFLYVSPRFEELFGYNPRTAAETPIDAMRRIHPEDLQRFLEDYWVPSQAGTTAACEYRIVRSDGAEHWVRAKAAPVGSADGKIRRSASTIEDITVSRKAEAALRAAQDAETKAILGARDAALAATETQRNFAASAAHELRTPTTAVLGFVEEVLDRDALTTDDRKFLDVAYRNALRLSALIDDLLVMGEADIGSARMIAIATPITTLVESVLSSLSAVAQRVEVAMSSEFAANIDGDSDLDRLSAMADPIRLEQALTNLVGNALKFTPPGGQVRVRVGVAEDTVQINVVDTGIGIDAAALEHIFDRFYRAKQAVGVGIKGTGLGLPIARQMIEAQGGQLTVTSVIGEGSIFTITLPAATRTGSSQSEV